MAKLMGTVFSKYLIRLDSSLYNLELDTVCELDEVNCCVGIYE